MGNKKNRIYAVILVASTILFIIAMVARIFGMNFTASPNRVSQMVNGNSYSVKERLGDLDDYVERHGPDVIYNELFYGHSYEPEFDSYWEFADIQVTGVRGRFSEDNTKDREKIENYIAACTDAARKEAAQAYLDLMN